jgi:hypothetical protein
MKKLFIPLLSLLLIYSCKKNDAVYEQESAPQNIERSCASEEMLKAQLAIDPSLRTRMQQIEEYTRKAIAGEAFRGRPSKTIDIPVVVHVLYNTAEENISDAQIQSQIDVLNEDFNLKNADNGLVPSIFSGVKADVGARFTLSQTIRKYSAKKIWAITDNMKFTSRGGSDAVDPQHKLNMWVCNLGQSVLGFAYYPGIKPELDGVVILYSAFGRTGTLLGRFNKGRTATHEIGHWMNLRHIWGDATCGNDLVDDTPRHTTANFGCPEFPHYNNCGDNAIEMTMNYMDYTDDACMFMFSNGQRSRMLAVFGSGGPRESFVQ